MSLLLKEGNSIISRLFSVINGLVPLILVQQVTNLVNKFAILLHKYRFSQDCRNGLCVMSGNDGCRGRLLSACCKFFKRMYHPGSSANELTLKAKDDESGGLLRCWKRVFSACCSVFNASSSNVMLACEQSELPRASRNIMAILLKRMYHPGHSANSLRSKPSVTGNCVGRSMIEMLGVLAIIGVLSVEGIAGYSKAMEQFRINKAIAEYSFLIQGLLEHLDAIKRMTDKNYGGQNGLVDFVQAAHLVPETWIKNRDDVNFQMKDTYGNIVQIFSRRQRLVIDLYLGGFTKVGENKAASLSFSPKFCASIMQNVVQPLSSVLNYTYITYNYKTFYGNETCSANRKCIRNLTLSEINSICRACTGQANNFCGIALEFN